MLLPQRLPRKSGETRLIRHSGIKRRGHIEAPAPESALTCGSSTRPSRAATQIRRLPLYRYRDNGDHVYYGGVMAQDVERRFPAAVTEAGNGCRDVNDGQFGLAFMTFSQMAATPSINHQRVRQSSSRWFWLLLALLMAPLAASGNEAPRIAMVIGNSAYHHARAIATPVNDAADIASALQSLGFEVDLRQDTSGPQLRSALETFAARAATADISVVYFAGHALTLNGNDYLIPVDATATPVRDESLAVSDIGMAAARSRLLGLVILDVRRGNPFPGPIDARQFANGPGTAAAHDKPSHNVLLFFAAEPGNEQEGQGRNSPLATALVKHLATSDREIGFLLRGVRDDVRKMTGSRQTPYMYGQLSGERIYLNRVRSAVLPCDRLAMEPGDAGTDPSPASAATTPRPEDAIAACTEATTRFPEVSRFHYLLGRSLFAAQNYPSALESYKHAFRLGEVRATYALGTMYEQGTGVPKDLALSRFYYETAAELDHPPAILRLAAQYETGTGGITDMVKAYDLYSRAAEDGDVAAINKIGEMTEKGQGHARDLKAARVLYERSTSGGNTDAMVNLARCYAGGIGGRRDLDGARRLLHRAAEAGSAPAKTILLHLQAPPGK